MGSGAQSRLGVIPNEGIKGPCVVAATSNIVLTGSQSIQGVTVVADDRVMVTGQTDPIENGIYIVATGDWSRASDFDRVDDITSGQIVLDSRTGDVYQIDEPAGTTWSPDVNAVTFTKIIEGASGTKLVASGGSLLLRAYTANGVNIASEIQIKESGDVEIWTGGVDSNDADSHLRLSGATGAQRVTFNGEVLLKKVTETKSALSGTTPEIDLDDGTVFSHTVATGPTTYSIINPGEIASFTLIVTNGGSQTVDWPALIKWAGGTAPALTVSGIDILTFVSDDAGTTWYGFIGGLDMQAPV